MKKWMALLLFLVTSISITGFSFIDNLILDRVIAGLATASFILVGLLYEFGVIDSKSEGSEAFKGVFVILLILALIIYLGIRKFQEWVLLWPLYVKILVMGGLGLLVVGVIVWAIYDYFVNEDRYID